MFYRQLTASVLTNIVKSMIYFYLFSLFVFAQEDEIIISGDFVREGYEKKRALVIGINNYKQPLQQLTGPVSDAAEIAFVLVSRFAYDEVVLLIDGKVNINFPETVEVSQHEEITKKVINNELRNLQKQTNFGDALLFFYAGHGIRGYILPSGEESLQKQKFSIVDLTKMLSDCNAHHTLMILDCCFSGAILEEGSQLRRQINGVVANLQDRLRWTKDMQLGHVFQNRVFQVITAGTGSEAVDDLAQKNLETSLQKELVASEKYHGQEKNQGNSPFTAVLLQGLRGHSGLANGLQLGSILGQYVSVSFKKGDIGSRQSPRFGKLGNGEGDYFFFPVGKVLNPELIASLYTEEDEYAELRLSACESLRKSIEKESNYEIRVKLTKSAIPHIARLLRENEVVATQVVAVETFAKLGKKYAKGIKIFQKVIPELVKLYGKNTNTELSQKIVECLGILSWYATAEANSIVEKYAERLEMKWKTDVGNSPFVAQEVGKKNRTFGTGAS